MNDMMTTIGITCFNAEDTIRRAIKSALIQSINNFEVLIVDDCSTDNSVTIILETIRPYPNSRLICHQKNSGAAASRNTILREAKGEIIVFFDDDDESFPDRVEIQLRKLIDYESCACNSPVLCYASGVRKYSNGYILDLPAIGSQGKSPNGKELADYLLFYHRHPDRFYGSAVPTCALLARTKTLKDIGGFDKDLRRVEDNDIAIRLALAGAHFVGVPQKLFIQHSTSAPDKSPEKNLEAEQSVVRKHRSYLEDSGYYYYALHWHKLRYWHFKRRYARILLEFLGIFIRYPLTSTRHFLTTAPRRLLHEWNMRAR
jgi:glycosyltransferase involved in cell wall biosynthesis